ncbi:UDP-N-acetylglucosamine--undecaprenyl-phosphate N-acetylglucosaminephosphotransferase [Vibrio sp. TH_r3]|uniref:UDP-N-acetylglucosamine--undecaprenyl-phosphate N-acetylglucosaminephosphotransferase n=1 Tax=Vibrio sp. TH_r3 TaxID=3082084 RepID=UPI00295437B4|nr:UDP-N-acetylglucosamine--undecaprenyl-phosphate N-acetylglucosaminephosphotransferase [Vibrio sp. TH_r3]MDV7104600.1 UDP-N-acetylglucosamine--undecaprenyl-phosphate N-acetylglucosaminephosphotransferase [Vibrio sp. TH_r3]
MFLELFFVFIYSFLLLFMLRKAARKVGLVDMPSPRKRHKGAVPLVGGLAICVCITQLLVFKPDLISHSEIFIGSIVTLAVIGALDDMFDISVKIRLFVQTMLAIVMLSLAGIELLDIGNIIGEGNVHLNLLAPIATIVAVVGAINAFNMIDGIDGLLGGLSMTVFGGLSFLLIDKDQTGLAYLSIAFIVAMIPYVCMNLGVLGRQRKVFMGDAGSMVIGFTVIWLLLEASQNTQQGTVEPIIRPITALWIIAVPLMDMAAIMIRRMRRGVSPFKPDREHLHHIFQRLGFSSRETLLIICLISIGYVGFGIYGEINAIDESVMFALFMICFVLYAVVLSYVWRITHFLRKLRGSRVEGVFENDNG